VVEFTHILCPTDLSESSRRSLTYAAALARWYTAQLTVSYVVPTFDPMPVRSGSLDGPVQIVYPVSREEVLEELRRVVDDAGAGSIDAILTAEAGDPSAALREIATVATPDTLPRWHRRLIARKWTYARKPGRRGVVLAIRRLVVRMAEENPTSGLYANSGGAQESRASRRAIHNRSHLESSRAFGGPTAPDLVADVSPRALGRDCGR
jgi:hypothetical protein